MIPIISTELNYELKYMLLGVAASLTELDFNFTVMACVVWLHSDGLHGVASVVTPPYSIGR